MNLHTFAMDRCEQDVSLQNKYRSFAHNIKASMAGSALDMGE
jgi:hypothetical protein